MIKVASSGEACCGNCGAHLAIVCTGGCAQPDIVMRENATATMKRPRAHERTQRQDRPGICNWSAGCDAPVAPPIVRGRGRPPKKCPTHIAMIREYERTRKAKNAVAA